MATMLAQTRNMTLADAITTMEELAHVECACAVIEARKGKRLAEIESEFKAKADPEMEKRSELRDRLEVFCKANAHLFAEPRTMKTPFGKFGLRTVHDVGVANKELAIQALLERGYADCIRTSQDLVKPAVRKRLEAGESIPGVAERTLEEVEIKVSETLVKAAIREA